MDGCIYCIKLNTRKFDISFNKKNFTRHFTKKLYNTKIAKRSIIATNCCVRLGNNFLPCNGGYTF